MREVPHEAAEQHARAIAALPIDIVGVGAYQALARQVAIYKASHKMTDAHCFVAALAKLTSAELLTGDPEFKAVAKEVKANEIK